VNANILQPLAAQTAAPISPEHLAASYRYCEHIARTQALFPLLHPPGRPTLRSMMGIYRSILDDIERSGYDVYSRRARQHAEEGEHCPAGMARESAAARVVDKDFRRRE
jgi:hypothetical protein